MPIKSRFPDIDETPIDIWSWFAHSPRDYPKDHSKTIARALRFSIKILWFSGFTY
jgi:hypothetical protein